MNVCVRVCIVCEYMYHIAENVRSRRVSFRFFKGGHK